jgi:hypothetical protein
MKSLIGCRKPSSSLKYIIIIVPPHNCRDGNNHDVSEWDPCEREEDFNNNEQ